MDYANDNRPVEVERYRGRFPILALALLASLALWFIVGMAAWQSIGGWFHGS